MSGDGGRATAGGWRLHGTRFTGERTGDTVPRYDASSTLSSACSSFELIGFHLR